MNVVNVWLSLAFQQTLLPILPPNYMKEMPLLQEMSAYGKELVILHLSLQLFWQMVTGDDTGQSLFSL
jgi:hypothetical protein